MKKALLIALLAFSSLNAQETEFKFDKNGLTDFVVSPVEGKTSSDLYLKTLEWISKSYTNPKEVIKAQIENDFIRMEGSTNTLMSMKILGKKTYYPTIYTLEISFKDGKYKFDVTGIKFLMDGDWVTVSLTSPSPYFDKKGVIKNPFKSWSEDIPPYFNKLNKELSDYLLGVEKKKEDW